jgi:hypothetical protein
VTSLNFYPHYFVASTAAFAFAIATFLEGRRLTPVRWMVLGLLAVALVVHAPRTVTAVNRSQDGARRSIESARQSAGVAHVLARSLPRGSRILVYAYEPGIYLQSGHDAVGRFANAQGLRLTSARRQAARVREYIGDMGGADAIVTKADHSEDDPKIIAALQAEFVAVCGTAVAPYEIYLSRRLLAHGHVPRCQSPAPRHMSRRCDPNRSMRLRHRSTGRPPRGGASGRARPRSGVATGASWAGVTAAVASARPHSGRGRAARRSRTAKTSSAPPATSA